MTKTMARVRAATSVWKTVSHRAGNPAARLTTTHETTAARTSSAAAGREASRSTRDSHRLTRDLDGSPGGSGSATVSGSQGYFSPSFLASSSRPIFDRPGRSRFLAISYSSARVLGDAPPLRLRWATAAACLPSAVRVLAGMWAIVFLLVAACWAFFTLRLAACDCLLVAIVVASPSEVPAKPAPTR